MQEFSVTVHVAVAKAKSVTGPPVEEVIALAPTQPFRQQGSCFDSLVDQSLV